MDFTLKDPIRVAPKQITELERLIANRIDPDTCQPYTAGKPRRRTNWKVSVNRPIQTVTKKHQLVYCECVDWHSRRENDLAYCAQPMEERGVFPLIEEDES